MDHRAIVAGLSVEDRRDLTTKADAPGIFRLAVHGGLVVVLGALVAARIPLWPVLVLPQGILIIFLFTTLHETIHETAFRTPWLNRAIATVTGFLILLPPAWFRYFHFAHHRHTHDPDNDPELMSPKPETTGEYLRYLSGGPYWIGMVRVVATNAAGRNCDTFVPEKGRDKVVLEARVFVIAYAVLLAGSLAAQSALLLWVWIVPVLVGQPFLRAYLLAEHSRCPHVANMLENTRTTFTTRLVRFIAWNMPYHAEHHSYPAVPFHRLPRFHEIVAEHLRTTERGYVRFHRKLLGSFHRPAG
ncbi:fatty acid desaturase [Mesorhizobium sp. M00.F.Ca.ET.216.01.1.1]|nr:fatty acid desaturase [Mesorhizobium sp. M00.F.Ca.ET.216.01.1.1]TIS57863.1 MAG: fatty acid desaturase [Mesorhizobium sp.]TIS90614.1 MAG: fatty acid desaturase [Mesorhizobium sp.]TJW13378.1 MAG: fatty acid desaturase [Mesorhizobium sp.]TJW46729.1 MAG: fatty acid desaturase [Mesorhizobium sp.]